MNTSILDSTKQALGLAADYTPFDQELIMHINTFLGVLHQLGIGIDGFSITDNTATWADFVGDTGYFVPEIKTWMALRVKQIFDPPASSVLAQAIKEQVDELTWRIVTKAEYGNGT